MCEGLKKERWNYSVLKNDSDKIGELLSDELRKLPNNKIESKNVFTLCNLSIDNPSLSFVNADVRKCPLNTATFHIGRQLSRRPTRLLATSSKYWIVPTKCQSVRILEAFIQRVVTLELVLCYKVYRDADSMDPFSAWHRIASSCACLLENIVQVLSQPPQLEPLKRWASRRLFSLWSSRK